MSKTILIVEEEEKGRLDTFLALTLDASRSHIKNLIEKGNVLVGGEVQTKAGFAIKKGQIVEVEIPEIISLNIEPENLPIDIVFEDEHLAVINKPQNMSVHPSGNIVTGTLVNALLFHLKSLSSINGVERPGIVHRLDKNTSGLMVVAKNDKAHISLSNQIAEKTAIRKYLALVEGHMPSAEGNVTTYLGRDPRDRKKIAVLPSGRLAITNYSTMREYKDYALVCFELKTGRTHQIRVHAKHLSHPIVGDEAYGFAKQRFNLAGQLLHSYYLKFTHPASGEIMEFEVPLPYYFEEILKKLKI